MRIAIVNTGASSLKLVCLDCRQGHTREIQRIEADWRSGEDIAGVLKESLDSLEGVPDAFGHRFVHGGPDLGKPVTVTAEVEALLEEQLPLAPLHNGVALAAIRAVRAAYPYVPCLALFDTEFHSNRPAESTRYALPDELVRRFHFRRYGFHGFAHASLVDALAEARGRGRDAISAVTLQLGDGCSACAIRCGRSIETSMGFTPLEGLVMASRSGSIDPAIVLQLVRAGYDADRIETELTRHSGLRALAGTADMREILAAEANGRQDAGFAIDLFCHHVVLTVGAYFTLLDGEGVLVFGGGIGAHSAQIRERIARGLSTWNIELDAKRNAANEPGCISAAGSRPVYVFRTNEEAVMASEVALHLGY